MTSSAADGGMTKTMFEFALKRSAQRLLPPRLILWERQPGSALRLDGQSPITDPGWRFYVAELEALDQ